MRFIALKREKSQTDAEDSSVHELQRGRGKPSRYGVLGKQWIVGFHKMQELQCAEGPLKP